MTLNGLGAYPTDSYYDPDRPSWLPYWIDDSTESAAKYNSDSLLGQMGGVVGAATGGIASGVASATGGALSNLIGSTSIGGALVIAGVGLLAYAILTKK